jgi:uncharacterized membrane protein
MMLMMLWMVLAPVLVIGLVALVVGAGLFAADLRFPRKPDPGAREILAQRYAQGDINTGQYDQILADIAN